MQQQKKSCFCLDSSRDFNFCRTKERKKKTCSIHEIFQCAAAAQNILTYESRQNSCCFFVLKSHLTKKHSSYLYRHGKSCASGHLDSKNQVNELQILKKNHRHHAQFLSVSVGVITVNKWVLGFSFEYSINRIFE